MAQVKEIAKNLYLIRSDEKMFHRNIYIKRIERNDGKVISIVFDPGTKQDLAVVSSTLRQLIGGVQNLNIIFVNHQDPDVTSNLMPLLSSAPKAVVVASEDTWRLIKMYGIPESRFKAVEDFGSSVVSFKNTNVKLQFIPSPFCHFRGAVMVYDLESRTLLSGDLFGGLNTRKGEGVYANLDSLEGIAMFHEIYMPSSKALRRVIERIELLSPSPLLIAPQHGDVIQKDYIPHVLNRLKNMAVGLDLFEAYEIESELFLPALQEFLENLSSLHPSLSEQLVQHLSQGGDFTRPMILQGNQVVNLKVSPENAIHFLYDFFSSRAPDRFPEIEALLSSILEQYGIKIPSFLKDTQDLSPTLGELPPSRPSEELEDLFQ